MAHQGRGIFMLTKSNNTSIKDIEKIMGHKKTCNDSSNFIQPY